MTNAKEELMLAAVQALRSHCDGAVSEDKVGFAGPDVSRGHALADTSFDRWTGADKQWAFKTLRKYKKQLAKYGINYEEIPEPQDKTVALVDFVDGQFVMQFRYDWKIIEKIKDGVPGRRWDGAKRQWTAPHTVQAVAAIKALEIFAWTDAAKNAVANAAESEGELIAALQARTIDFANHQFVIKFPFSPETVAQMRTVPGAAWNPTEKFWGAPLDARAIARLRELEGFDWTEAATQMAEDCERIAAANLSLSHAKSADMFEVPDLLQELYPFQKAGVLFAVTNKWVIIGDEPGLGKTPQGLATIHAANAYPALVICPTSVTENWRQEALRWLPIGHDQAVVANSQTTAADLANALIVFVGYDILADGLKEIEEAKAQAAAEMDEEEFE